MGEYFTIPVSPILKMMMYFFIGEDLGIQPGYGNGKEEILSPGKVLDFL